MTESYLRCAGHGTIEDFPETIKAGMQDYASRLSAVVRDVPPDDYAMLVVVLDDLAASMRTLTPAPLQTAMDGMRGFFSPTIISAASRRETGT